MNLRLADRVRSRLPGAGLLGWKRRDEEEKGALKARPKPTAESILWSPVELTEFELAADQRRPHELFVRPDVLRKARYHLTGSGERFGFLLGRRFSCPDTGSPWVEISDVLPSSVALPGRAEAPRFRLLRTAAAKEGEKRGLELLGWYHEHRLLGIALTDLDVDLHRDNFQEPWQCALLFVSGGPKPAGAFIQPWDGQQYFSRSFVSFRELEEGAGEAPAGTRSTCIEWSNYEPDRPVRLTDPLGTGGGTSALEASPARRPVWDAEVSAPKPRAPDARREWKVEPAPSSPAAKPPPPPATPTPPAPEPPPPAPSPPTSEPPRASSPSPVEPPRPDPPRPSAPAPGRQGPLDVLNSWHQFLAEPKPRAPDPLDAAPSAPASEEAVSPTRPREPEAAGDAAEAPGPPESAPSHAQERTGEPDPAPHFVAEDILFVLPPPPAVGIRERFRAWFRRRLARR